MANNNQKSSQPRVNDRDFSQRLQLQLELMHLDTQLRNLHPARAAAVSPPELQARRKHVASELKKLTPRPHPKAGRPSTLPWHPGMSMHSHLAAPRFGPDLSPWFGFSGAVRTGSPLQGFSLFPSGVRGKIETVSVADSSVFFGGDIAAHPIEGYPSNPGHYHDDLDIYFWLQNWIYVIPFPPPVVDSTFTYKFDVRAQVASALVDGSAQGWSYVSVGEAPDYSGEEIAITRSAAFPIAQADLDTPTGVVAGTATVQRSFAVHAGNTPAVAVLVGFSAGLEPRGEVVFDDQMDCYIIIGRDGECERLIDFRYDPPQPVFSPG